MERCITVYDSNIQELSKHNFDEAPFFLFEGEVVDTGFNISPPEGYEMPQQFPNCCDWHTSLITNHLNWFNRFPNCCKGHKELKQKTWFKKENFNGTPFKITRSVLFTTHHVHKVIDNDNWYEDIVHFIEYALEGFGSPSIGSDLYLSDVKHYVAHIKTPAIPKKKREKIIEYIESQGAREIMSPPDLNLLHSTFQKWVKALPELSIFSEFKVKNAGKIPQQVLFYESDYNPYLERTTFRVRTKSQLIKLLVNTTKNSLANVDSDRLLKDGLITDISKHQLDILGGKRKLSQDKLLGKYSKGELKYVDVMHGWLLNEEDYFTSVAKLLVSSNILPNVNRPDILDTKPPIQINNNIVMGNSGTLQMIQGDNATQNNNDCEA